MRFVRAVRVRVEPARRADYRAVLAEAGAMARETGAVKGFYLMEREGEPGTYEEFWEFADAEAAAAFEHRAARDPAWKALAARRRALVLPGSEDASDWMQRI
jgi:quinol monooxygenase YgiN